MRNRILSIFALMACFNAMAQIPEGYYASLKGKSGSQLKKAVHALICNADVLDYGSGAGRTWDGFYKTDRLADNQVVDRYSNDIRYFSSTTSAPSGMNIEHSFPKSWWGGSQNQAYQDLYNLMPSEKSINSAKANYPMGEVLTDTKGNGCTKVGKGASGNMLWEPADKWKGDFARGYMYMATAYQNFTWQSAGLQILQQDEHPTLQQWAYTLYLRWARTDSPDEIEIARNEAVSKIQGNRNPFVDFPNLMEYVWGDSINTPFNPETTVKSAAYSNGDAGQGDSGDGDDAEAEMWETVYDAAFTGNDGGCTVNQATLGIGFDVWTRSSKYGWMGKAFNNNKNHAADASLITPEIDLSGYAKAAVRFSHAVNYSANPKGGLSVNVVYDGNIKELGDAIKWPAGTNWTFVESGDIDISGCAGKKIKVEFRYTSTSSEAATWEIKNMTVKGVRISSAIENPSVSSSFNPSLPYDIYAPDGRRVTPQYKGVVIIKQGGVILKTVNVRR